MINEAAPIRIIMIFSGNGYRMVDRDGDFHQSRGKISIRKKIKRKDWRSLYGYDVFHSLVNAPTFRTIGILLGGYFIIIIIFSIFYYMISKIYGCNMVSNLTKRLSYSPWNQWQRSVRNTGYIFR